MYRTFIFCFFLFGCNNNQTLTENLSIKKDSPFIQRADSSLTKLRSVPPSHDSIDFQTYQFKDSVLVKKIQQFVSKVDNNRYLDSVQIENEEFMDNVTDGGGSMTGYFQNGKLVKIVEWYGLSWGISEVNYYFNNNELVYVNEKEKEFDYNDSSGIDHSRFGMFFDGNYYFNKGKIFDEISLGHGRLEVSGNDLEKVYSRRAKENKSIILKHKTK